MLYLGPGILRRSCRSCSRCLKHAALNDGVTLVQVTPTGTSLSSHAAASLHPLTGRDSPCRGRSC